MVLRQQTFNAHMEKVNLLSLGVHGCMYVSCTCVRLTRLVLSRSVTVVQLVILIANSLSIPVTSCDFLRKCSQYITDFQLSNSPPV